MIVGVWLYAVVSKLEMMKMANNVRLRSSLVFQLIHWVWRSTSWAAEAWPSPICTSPCSPSWFVSEVEGEDSCEGWARSAALAKATRAAQWLLAISAANLSPHWWPYMTFRSMACTSHRGVCGACPSPEAPPF